MRTLKKILVTVVVLLSIVCSNFQLVTAKSLNMKDVRLMAAVMKHEAGNYNDELQQYIGQVILNRKNSKGYPNTVRKVVMQRGQYPGAYRATPSKMAIKNAKRVLLGTGKYSSKMPKSVVFQANFRQGKDTWKAYKVRLGSFRSTVYFCSHKKLSKKSK